jgi:hypothetical protein
MKLLRWCCPKGKMAAGGGVGLDLDHYYCWYRSPSISTSGNRGFLYLIHPLDSHYRWGGTSSPPPQLAQTACAGSSIWSRDGTWVPGGWSEQQAGGWAGLQSSGSIVAVTYCTGTAVLDVVISGTVAAAVGVTAAVWSSRGSKYVCDCDELCFSRPQANWQILADRGR